MVFEVRYVMNALSVKIKLKFSLTSVGLLTYTLEEIFWVEASLSFQNILYLGILDLVKKLVHAYFPWLDLFLKTRWIEKLTGGEHKARFLKLQTQKSRILSCIYMRLRGWGWIDRVRNLRLSIFCAVNLFKIFFITIKNNPQSLQVHLSCNVVLDPHSEKLEQ